ncbi:MAG: XdhC family protein [Pseudomonadota bacterium]
MEKLVDSNAQVLDAIVRWKQEGHRFALVTVARTWGSAPRPAGSWMALREDGQVQGSVSGGCIEDDLIERMLHNRFESTLPFVVTYGATPEQAQRYGLPCGGTMELVIEPRPDLAALAALHERISHGQLVRRSICVGYAGTVIASGCMQDKLSWDGHTLTTLHGPTWRLLIVGAGQTSGFLAQMAQALGYQVFVCDPRQEYAAQWNVPGSVFLAGMPDDVAIQMNLDPHSAVVALTHDPKLDDMVLLEALKSSAFYVGALGSAANNQRRRIRLLQHFDLSQSEIDKLHGPVGLAIGSRTPAEIAVSVLAEMTAVRNGVWTKNGLQRKRKQVDAGCVIA